MHDSVKQHARTEFREEVWKQLAEGFRFVPGDFDDDVAFDKLRRTIEELDEVRGTGGNHAFYLAIPPAFFGDVVEPAQGARPGRRAGDGSWRRVVVEKPFGHDLESARELNATLAGVFPPSSVFRIDHYLGKETVQNILAMRFANEMFEPIWNSNYVDHVQITMAEDIGIGGRAGYYDGIGAARDVIQNHLLQLMALVAMEEPTSFDAESLRIEKQKVLASRRPPPAARPDHRPRPVRRRLGGRREGAPASSRRRASARPRPPRRSPRSRCTSTTGAGPGCRSTCAPASGSAAGSPRWPSCSSGRRTCRSARTATEELTHNALVIRVQPDEGMTMRFGSQGARHRDGDPRRQHGLRLRRLVHRVQSPEAYERLILDVLLGDPPLFPRHEEVELSWQILDPILDHWAAQGASPSRTPSGHLGPRVGRRRCWPATAAIWRRP